MTDSQQETLGTKWKNLGLTQLIVGIMIGAVAIVVSPWAMWNGSAEQLAQQTASSAVLNALEPICVARVTNNPEYSVRVAELTAQESPFQRTQTVRDMIEDFGSAKLPGMETADAQLLRACAEGVLNALETPTDAA